MTNLRSLLSSAQTVFTRSEIVATEGKSTTFINIVGPLSTDHQQKHNPQHSSSFIIINDSNAIPMKLGRPGRTQSRITLAQATCPKNIA
jgi:hypothetical protein